MTAAGQLFDDGYFQNQKPVGNLDWNLAGTSQFMTDLFYLLVVSPGFHAFSGQSRFANAWPLTNR